MNNMELNVFKFLWVHVLLQLEQRVAKLVTLRVFVKHVQLVT
jgi:hypothetical protein